MESKKYMQQHIRRVFLFTCCLAAMAAHNAHARPSMLCDFENGVNTNDGPDGDSQGYFRHQDGTDYHLPIDSPGALGTNYCVRYDAPASAEKTQSFYIANPESRPFILERGGNRLEAWIKLPTGYGLGNDRNFHIGTYTRPFDGAEQGTHYYHIFNLPPSNYWHHIVMNQHPQSRSGSSVEPVDDVTWNQDAGYGDTRWHYLEGFTRFYFHTKDYNYKPSTDWSWYIDEVRFFQTAEPENDTGVTSVSASYFGNGHFGIGWHGEIHTEDSHHYEVRYSTSPITNANYSSASIAPGCADVTRMSGSYSWMYCDFEVGNFIDKITYYFAIKVLDSDSPYVSKIDYPLAGNNISPVPTITNIN